MFCFCFCNLENIIMVSLLQDSVFYKNHNNFVDEKFSDASEDKSAAFHFNPFHSLTIEDQREKLPIRQYRDKILYCLENNQVVIIVGETGSGKSTQIPLYLHEYGWHLKGSVGITEPRQAAATNLANRIAIEIGTVVNNVEVTTKLKAVTNEDNIKVMTENILLREIFHDPLLTEYGVIIVNGTHERNASTDIVLGLLKKIMHKRLTLKVIICSTTIYAEFLQNYFSARVKVIPKIALISVNNRAHPISIFYIKEPVANFIQVAVETVWKIHKNEAPTGDVLVFLTGQREILEAQDMLRDYKQRYDCGNLEIFPMFGTQTNSEQLKVFLSAPKGVRKVVLATSIAESSIAIPGIAYVVDCGFVKLNWFNAKNFSDNIVMAPISKATAKQRALRASLGRSGGKVYRLYSEEFLKQLTEQTPPEMRRIDLYSTVIQLKALGIDNVLRFDFPSPPPAKNLLTAIEALFALGAIDDKGNLTQPLGYFLAEVPLGPMLGKMLYMSGEIGCSEEIISIAAMLQVQPVFAKPSSGAGQMKARVAKRNFEVAEGDLITLLNVYTAFDNDGRTKEFCRRYFLNYSNLKRASHIREKLLNLSTKKFGIRLASCKGDLELLGKCITAGYFPNAAYLHHSGVYKTIHGNVELNVHTLSSLNTLQKPDFVLYCQLIRTTKLFMKDLTVIKEEWLTEYAGHYYHKSSRQ